MSRLLALAALVLVASACGGSAEGAYSDGMDFETAGDYAGAADAYALALERDRDLPNVAGRLTIAGREAITQYLAAANTTDLEAAATAYLQADALIERAGALGIDLERPATFEGDRDAAFQEAVRDLYGRGRGALADGEYADAIDLTERARRFDPAGRSAVSLDGTIADAHGDWAEADLEAGRYRSALGRVDDAIAAGPERDDLLDLRLAVLEAGTVVVAVFPAEGDADELFLRDLSDAMVEDHMLPPPPFIGVVDPSEVRRWERRERGRRRPDLGDSRRLLGEAALEVGADMGIVAVLGPIEESITRGRERNETATVRSTSARATYQQRRDEIDLEAGLDIVIVDAAGRLVCEETVRRSVEESVDVASYNGDWQDLELSRAERRRFASDVRDLALEAGMGRLRDVLATAAADRVTACVGRQVP